MFARAKGRCEACWGWLVADEGHLDHFFGRARAESVENCWALCDKCDTAKTASKPSRAEWQRKFIRHATRYGYLPELDWARRDLEKLEFKGMA